MRIRKKRTHKKIKKPFCSDQLMDIRPEDGFTVAVCNFVSELHGRKGITYLMLSNKLNSEGIRTYCNRRWTPFGVRRLMADYERIMKKNEK
jgi:hypothetical protein